MTKITDIVSLILVRVTEFLRILFANIVRFGKIIYYIIGSGGRDLSGSKYSKKNLHIAPQSKDQPSDGANLSLIKSIVTQNPIRVIRGYKLDSPFAPLTGYRYDGKN